MPLGFRLGMARVAAKFLGVTPNFPHMTLTTSIVGFTAVLRLYVPDSLNYVNPSFTVDRATHVLNFGWTLVD